jgi:two-component system, OmpR family, sensor kinase
MRDRLDRLPLRTRLVAGMALLVALGLLAAGAAATSALRAYQLQRVDAQLSQAAQSPVLRAELDGRRSGRGGPGPRGRLPGELHRVLLDADGAVVAEADAGPDDGRRDGPEVPDLTAADARDRGLRPFTVPGTDDGTWRVVAVPVQIAGQDATVLLAADLEPVGDTAARLVALQLAVGAVVLAGVTVLASLLVRGSLRGLAEVEQAATRVAGGDLASRVPERHPATEVGRLAGSFNRMVSQLQSAFAAREASEQRLRRFVADASHELRTPLTAVRGFAELHRQGAVSGPDDVARLLRRIEDEATRMGLLVDDLLLLARLDEQRPLDLAEVDLTVLAADAVQDAAVVHPDRQVVLDAPGPVHVRGDEARLRQVVGNLLANACQHTPVTTPVRVRVRAHDGSAVLEVADEGPGMDAQTAARVFERFYRADASRTRASGGSGLGLSIVASLVRAHGGDVAVDSAPGRGSVFRVVLPR